MEIQDLGAIGELVSSVVITITLILLVFETRHAKEATLQGNRQLRQQIHNTIHLGVAQNPGLAASLVKANEHLAPEFGSSYRALAESWGLAPDEYVRLVQHLRAEFGYFEYQFFTELPDSDRRALDSHVLGAMRGPVWQRFWKDQRAFFHPEFVEHVNGLIERSGVTVGDLPDDFAERLREPRG